MKRHRRNHEKKRAPLAFEVLEERELLACTVNAVGDTLTVSDPLPTAANKITLNDTNGTITGKCGKVAVNAAGINTVNINSGGGNDKVTFTLTGRLTAGQSLTLNVDLGDGTDMFQAKGAGVNGAGAALNVNVQGGAGNDQIKLLGLGVSDGTINVTAQGGAGADNINASAIGALGGLLSLNADGGDDNDIVQAKVLGQLTSPAAQVQAALTGGNGDDRLLAVGPDDPNVQATIDGGVGSDTCVPRDLSTNCER